MTTTVEDTSGLTVDERDVLAEVMLAAVAPKLIRAVLERDTETVGDLLAGLEWLDLAALVIVLAEAAGAGG